MRTIARAGLALLLALPFAAGAEPTAPRLVFASLERTGCFGPCPVYRVDVLGDGTVLYQGSRFVKHKGRRQARLGAEQLAALDRAFDAAGFLALAPTHRRAEVADRAEVTLAYATAVRSGSVRWAPGDRSAPAALARLAQEVGRIVELERWIGTETERDALARRRPYLEDTILRCTTTAANYRGRFVLDELGRLSLQAWRGEEAFACRLAVEELSYAPDAQVGNVTVRATLAGCRAKDGIFEDRSLQQHLILVLKLFEGPREASADWLRHAQPSPCVLQAFDEEGVRDAARDFAEQLRLPAPPPSPPGLGEVLLGAVERGDVALVRSLATYDAAVRATNRRGQQPLAVAALRNGGPPWLEIARVLVRSGAPLDARDGDGLTALGHGELRARRGKDGPAAEMVALLVKAGADPSASRFALTVGDRAVALDHRTLMSPECRPATGEPTCDVIRALPKATTLGLARNGGANPGALVCEAMGGDTVIARHASGDEDALCVFEDGSLVMAARLYEVALENDLRR